MSARIPSFFHKIWYSILVSKAIRACSSVIEDGLRCVMFESGPARHFSREIYPAFLLVFLRIPPRSTARSCDILFP